MVYKLNKDNDDDNLSPYSISRKSYGDDSVVVINKKPPANPAGKTPFPCILGDVLPIMQDRLNANASKANIDSSSIDTLRLILSKVIECRRTLFKIAIELDNTMEITGDGERVEIAELLHKSTPYSVPKKKSPKGRICEMLVVAWSVAVAT